MFYTLFCALGGLVLTNFFNPFRPSRVSRICFCSFALISPPDPLPPPDTPRGYIPLDNRPLTCYDMLGSVFPARDAYPVASPARACLFHPLPDASGS